MLIHIRKLASIGRNLGSEISSSESLVYIVSTPAPRELVWGTNQLANHSCTRKLLRGRRIGILLEM